MHCFDFRARFELEQFDIECQFASARNGNFACLRVGLILWPIAKRGWNPQAIFAAALHDLQAFGKAGDDARYRKASLRVLVKNGAVLQHALITYEDHVIVRRVGAFARFHNFVAQARWRCHNITKFLPHVACAPICQATTRSENQRNRSPIFGERTFFKRLNGNGGDRHEKFLLAGLRAD